jgi:hypothetical protein
MEVTFDVSDGELFDIEVIAHIEKHGHDYLLDCFNKLSTTEEHEIYLTYLKLYLTDTICCKTCRTLYDFVLNINRYENMWIDFVKLTDENEIFPIFVRILEIINKLSENVRFECLNFFLKQTKKIFHLLPFFDTFDENKEKSIYSILNTKQVLPSYHIERTFITNEPEFDICIIENFITIFNQFNKGYLTTEDTIFFQNIFFGINKFMSIYGCNEKIITIFNKILRYCFNTPKNNLSNFMLSNRINSPFNEIIHNIGMEIVCFIDRVVIYFTDTNQIPSDEFMDEIIEYMISVHPTLNMTKFIAYIINNSNNPHHKINIMEKIICSYKLLDMDIINATIYYMTNVDLTKHLRQIEITSHVYCIFNYFEIVFKKKIIDKPTKKQILFRIINYMSNIMSFIDDIKNTFDTFINKTKSVINYDNIPNVYEFILNSELENIFGINKKKIKSIIEIVGIHLKFILYFASNETELDIEMIDIMSSSLTGIFGLFNAKMLFYLRMEHFIHDVYEIFNKMQNNKLFMKKMADMNKIVFPTLDYCIEFYSNLLPIKTNLIKLMNIEEENDEQDVDLLDKLTFEPIIDPVMIPGSFEIYDRKSITTQLQLNGTNPITREPLSISDFDDFNKTESVKVRIQEWKTKYGK